MADESRRLKKMHAELAMRKEVLKDALEKKAVRTSQRQKVARGAIRKKGYLWRWHAGRLAVEGDRGHSGAAQAP